ncbi:dinB [Ecytonucleospora hepatopenaei]|uniref:DNA polymerase kappa n=1 Tax=Ecytonucleospora hepatopenaei TaxID=646526 RepID=A0A1W0E9F5_9MICR|nr:dinB [Ecytonucleospora hepatopenaei]
MKENASVKFTVLNTTNEQFEENEENRMFAAQERAEHYKKILKEKEHEIEHAHNIVKYELYNIQNEWPALYGIKKPSKFYVHMDLDSFDASVEMLLNPEYKNIPLAVGNMNMIAACNYRAREYNVRAGMPGYHAKKLCPHLVITSCRMEKYNYFSEKVMNILSCYDNNIETYGIDECCLVFDEEKLKKAYDFYNYSSGKGRKSKQEEMPPILFDSFTSDAVSRLVEKIRKIVFREIKLTISAGISVCRGMSKFASNINKPNGQKVIKEHFDSHIIDLKVDKLNGIGKMTKLTLLKTFGIETVRDMRKKYAEICVVFPHKTFVNLLRISQGLSVYDTISNARSKGHNMKSIGNSYTIKRTVDYVTVIQHLWEISNQVWNRMARANYFGGVITLTLKYRTFKQTTRQKKMSIPVNSVRIIFETVVELLQPNLISREGKELFLNEIVRMVGVSVSNLYKIDSVKNIGTFLAKPLQNELVDTICKCIICHETFFNISEVNFNTHVNTCIDKISQCQKKKKQKILHFINK